MQKIKVDMKGKYDILVSDAEFNLRMAKDRKLILDKRLEIACNRLEVAEEHYYKESGAVCNHEKVIRSLTAKLTWMKRKNK